MNKRLTDEHKGMLAELGFDFIPRKTEFHISNDQHAFDVFREVQKFFDEHGRMPNKSNSDPSEYLLALRYDNLDKSEKSNDLTQTLGQQEIPENNSVSSQIKPIDDMDNKELLAELGIETSPITQLKHVRSAAARNAAAPRKAAKEISRRNKCDDFESFKLIFEKIQREIKNKTRRTKPFRDGNIKAGQFFIVNGQIAYVAEKEKSFIDKHGNRDARLRVIYDNGTENRQLKRTLQKSLTDDPAGRRITDPDMSSLPMFSEQTNNDDADYNGTLYVLRSTSNRPEIAQDRDLLHKIGITKGSVEKRIANAKNDPTFLMGEVEIAATYQLQCVNQIGIDGIKLENMIHRIFESAQIDIEIMDRFNKPYRPREWYKAPIYAINEAIERIGKCMETGEMIEFTYNPTTKCLQDHDDMPEPGF